MTQPWSPDNAWQYGHDPHECAYVLVGGMTDGADRVWASLRAEHPVTADEEPDEVLLGGAVVLRDPQGLAILSGGEDALDSIEEAVWAVEQARLLAKVDEPIDWREQPPVVVDEDLTLVQSGGYWVRPNQVAGLPARQEAARVRLEKACQGRFVGALVIAEDEGVQVIQGTTTEGDEVCIFAGPTHLDLIDETPDGELAELVLGDD